MIEINSGPIGTLVLSLVTMIDEEINNNIEEYEALDEDEVLLLANNGCRMADSGMLKKNVDINSNFKVHLVRGMMGNDKNTFYDLFYTHENNEVIKVFVIFADYFKDVKTEEVDDENGIPDLMGNNTYLYALSQIIEMFLMALYGPNIFSGPFNSCVTGTNYRMLPTLSAAIVLNQFKPLSENDTDGCAMTHNSIIGIIENDKVSIEDIFVGIRRRE